MTGPESVNENLEELRHRLDGLDEQLVNIIAERQELIALIGEAKGRVGRQIRDFKRERIVLDRARAASRKAHVDPDLCEAVFKLLIASSLQRQEQERVSRVGHGRGKSALVIGAQGHMGKWFVRFLEAQEYHVHENDLTQSASKKASDESPAWPSIAQTCDLILIAVPLSDTSEVLRTLEALRPRGVVTEIASIKAPVIPRLVTLQESGIRVASLHPMFGPDAELLAGRHVLSLEFPGAESTSVAQALFSETMAQVVPLPIHQHDRLMTYVLGMTHALNLTFGAALARSGEDAQLLSQLSSTTFNAQLAVTAAVAAENPRLYFEIQRQNPSGVATLDRLTTILGELRDVVAQSDAQAFTRFMQESRIYLQRRQEASAQEAG